MRDIYHDKRVLVADYFDATFGSSPIKTFQDLCALHGVEEEDVYRILHLKYEKLNISPQDERIFQIIIHPTFLDLPENFHEWRALLQLNYHLKYGASLETGKAQAPEIIRSFEIGSTSLSAIGSGMLSAKTSFDRHVRRVPIEYMGEEHSAYLFNTMPPSHQRNVVAILFKTLGEQGVADLQKRSKISDDQFLAHLRLALVNFALIGDGQDMVEVAPTPMAAHTMDRLVADKLSVNSPHYALVKKYIGIDRKRLADVAKHDLGDNNDIIELTLAMNAQLQASGAVRLLNPRQIFDSVFTQRGAACDPLLLLEIDNFIAQTVPADKKNNVRVALHKRYPEGVSAALPEVAQRLAQQLSGPPHYAITLAQASDISGIAEHELRSFIDNPRRAWIATDGQWEVNPASVLSKLTLLVGDPAVLIPPPAEPASVKKIVLPPTSMPKIQTVSGPVSVWQAAGYPDTLPVLFDGRITAPSDIDRFANEAVLLMPKAKQTDATRRMLVDAFKNPDQVFGKHSDQSYGCPSLPHLWLMWAMRPETQGLGREQTVTELAKTWGADENTTRFAREFTVTAPGAFAAWTIETVWETRDKVGFTGYGDVLTTIDGLADRTDYHFKKLLDYLQRVQDRSAPVDGDIAQQKRIQGIITAQETTLTAVLGPIRGQDRVMRRIKQSLDS